MKKLLVLVAFIAMVSSASFAQMTFGGGVTLGTDSSADGGMNLGLNVRGNYNINDQWSISPGFTFMLPSSSKYSVMGVTYKTTLTLWQLNADAHYAFAESGDFKFYGIGGLNISGASAKAEAAGVSETASTTDLGLDLGAGANYGKFYGELKYDTGFDQLAISVGMHF